MTAYDPRSQQVETQHNSAPLADWQPAPAPPLDAALARLALLPTTTVPAPGGALPAGSFVPLHPNPCYTGRDDALRYVGRLLALGQGPRNASVPTIVVSGPGGVGKSQFAAEVAHRYGPYFLGGVYWIALAAAQAVPAASPSRQNAPSGARPAVLKAAQAMPGLPPHFAFADFETQVALMREAWQSPLPRLLIFDDCADPALLAYWRPTSGGARVLVTSRQAHWDPALGVERVPMAALRRADSMALLAKLAAAGTQQQGMAWPGDTPLAPDRAALDPGVLDPSALDTGALDAIAAELDDLPLALHVAGSFLGVYANAVSPARYLGILRRVEPVGPPTPIDDEDLEPPVPDYSTCVARAVAVTYTRLDPDDPADGLARQLLARAACCAPGEPIPAWLLTKALTAVAEDVASVRNATVAAPDTGPAFQAAVAGAYRRLYDLGLLATSVDGEPLLPPLLSSALPLDDGALDGVERALLYAVTDWKSATNRAEKLPALPPWLGHLVYVTDRAFWRYDTYAALLTHHLGHLLRRAGDLSNARHYLAQSVDTWWEVQGSYLSTATMLEDLGGVLLDLGDFAAAETAYTRAYELWRKAVGDQHARTLGDLTNLGRVLMRKHDWAAARDTFARALAGYTALLGPDHPDTQAVQDLFDAVSSMLPE